MRPQTMPPQTMRKETEERIMPMSPSSAETLHAQVIVATNEFYKQIARNYDNYHPCAPVSSLPDAHKLPHLPHHAHRPARDTPPRPPPQRTPPAHRTPAHPQPPPQQGRQPPAGRDDPHPQPKQPQPEPTHHPALNRT